MIVTTILNIMTLALVALSMFYKKKLIRTKDELITSLYDLERASDGLLDSYAGVIKTLAMLHMEGKLTIERAEATLDFIIMQETEREMLREKLNKEKAKNAAKSS